MKFMCKLTVLMYLDLLSPYSTAFGQFHAESPYIKIGIGGVVIVSGVEKVRASQHMNWQQNGSLCGKQLNMLLVI